MPATAPSLLVHLGTENVRAIPRFLQDWGRDKRKLRIGTTVSLPHYLPDSAGSRIATFGDQASYVLAEPETHRMAWRRTKRGRQRAKIDYLQFDDATDRPVEFVDAVLKEQSKHDCSALISPWLVHGIEPGQGNLAATRSFAVAAADHPLAADHDLLLGVGVSQSILRDADECDAFGAEVLDWPDLPVYLRVHVTAPESFGQHADEEGLSGLGRLVSDFVQNERPVLLPQSGLVGWLMTAFGAMSAGTGISASLQRFAQLEPEGSGGGGKRLNWYFLPELLGFVQRDELALLMEVDGIDECPCPYCEEIDFSRRGEWNRDLAGLHYLWWCATLVSEASRARDARVAVSARVESAREQWRLVQEAEVELDPRSNPRHLAAWSEVVAAQ